MSKKNIYQKLHSACIEAGSVKKAEKVRGMHFNPLIARRSTRNCNAIIIE